MAVRICALWLAATMLLPAQGEDIFERVRRALAASGQSEAAIAELRVKNLAWVEARLNSVNAASDGERAELAAVRGAVAFLGGKMVEAEAAFRESEKLRPLKEEDRFTLAMALVKLGDDGQAREVLTRLANEHEESGIYWYWLGRLDYDQRRYKESVEKLLKATELDAKSARAWDSLGLAWDMQGRMEPARAAFEKAVSLNREQTPPSAWPPHNFGYLLFRLGETEAAEKALRESLTYDARLARTHYYLGRVLENEGRQIEAITEYRSAVNGDTQAADACYSLAMLYRKLHRETEALAMFAEFKRRKSAPLAR
jgi:tetratricopeptide (TPR) repeat protein